MLLRKRLRDLSYNSLFFFFFAVFSFFSWLCFSHGLWELPLIVSMENLESHSSATEHYTVTKHHYCYYVGVLSIYNSFPIVVQETVSGFWTVRNMYDFENVGFTNSVDGMKYLTCADCEYGPIGFLDAETKIHYVSTARVSYKWNCLVVLCYSELIFHVLRFSAIFFAYSFLCQYLRQSECRAEFNLSILNQLFVWVFWMNILMYVQLFLIGVYHHFDTITTSHFALHVFFDQSNCNAV